MNRSLNVRRWLTVVSLSCVFSVALQQNVCSHGQEVTNQSQEKSSSISSAAQNSAAQSSRVLSAKGIVFEDTNGNGSLDEGESGLAGVRVSNGLQIVETDSDGRYQLPLQDDQIVFVIKPNGFRTRLDKNQLPQFYYIHKPAGSPQLQYPGVAATGPLPSSIDFPLYAQDEPADFKAIMFGDPQPRDLKEVSYIAEDVIPEVIGTDASFGVTLGDIVFDDLSCFTAVNETYGLVGIPWYNVIGNHDINYDVKERKFANETFEATYGPSYYSFDYGNVHFVVMDNINYMVDPADGRGKYNAKFGTDQLQFVKNDLALVPQHSLVVLMMHIPLVDTIDRQDLYRLIEQRPFCMSISGHTHFHGHRYIDQTDGWKGKKPHHHVINVTVSGSWWGGQEDERGVPHTMMSDGAPNGHSVIQFNNTNYQLDFVPAGRPKSYQMNLNFPDQVQQNSINATEMTVNVFNAAARDTVEARVGWKGDWKPMKNVTGISPVFEAVFNRDKTPEGESMLTKPRPTDHLWQMNFEDLSKDLPVGHHLVQVRWTDRNGRKTIGNRVLRVIENVPAEKNVSAESAK